MRHLALLLAAASVLGTGCIVSSDTSCDRTLSLTWDFTDVSNVTRSGCGAAGVDFVDVYVNGGRALRFPCVSGGATIPVSRGDQVVTVEGISAAVFEDPGVIIYRDEFQADTRACGDSLFAAHPAEGTLTIDYGFTPVDSCTTGSFVWFSVFDEISLSVSAAVDEASANPTQFACGVPSTSISIALPVGTHTLERIEEVVPDGPGFAAAAANCGATTFDIARASVTTVPVTLADGITFCPASASSALEAGAPRPPR